MSEVTETVATPEVKISKSKLIAAAFKANGLDTPANEVAEFIKQSSNVEVTVSLINNVRHHMRKKKQERAAARKKAVPQTEETAPPVVATTDTSFDKLLSVKEFAKQIGGLAELKTVLEKLERLAS
jgi:hypothetical protein